MNILTDEEMKQIHADTFGKGVQSFARAIEAAALKKLAEHDMEPVAWKDTYLTIDELEQQHTGAVLLGYSGFENLQDGTNLYTETQLLAAQQKAADACAEYLIKGDHDDEFIASRGMIAGDWMEYL